MQTYNALTVLDREGVLLFETNYQIQSSLQFTCTNEELFRYEKNKTDLKKIIQILLRYYGGIFDNPVLIDEYHLAKKMQTSKRKIVALLKILEKDHIIHYRKKTNVSAIQFLVMREDDKVINRIKKRVNHRNALKTAKKEAILNYITNNSDCRSIQLLTYFKETNFKPCGICDVCLDKKKRKNDTKKIITSILNLLQEKEYLTAKELVFSLPHKEEEIIKSIRFLVENNTIKLNNANQYHIIKTKKNNKNDI